MRSEDRTGAYRGLCILSAQLELLSAQCRLQICQRGLCTALRPGGRGGSERQPPAVGSRGSPVIRCISTSTTCRARGTALAPVGAHCGLSAWDHCPSEKSITPLPSMCCEWGPPGCAGDLVTTQIPWSWMGLGKSQARTRQAKLTGPGHPLFSSARLRLSPSDRSRPV